MPDLPFTVLQVRSGPHENFHYVLGDPHSGEAVLVDPAFHVDRLVADAQELGLRPRTALFTHAHWDHIGGVPEVERHGIKEMAIHEAAAHHPKVQEARDAGLEVRLLADGDRMDLGMLAVTALHTPGHQPESTCFVARFGTSRQVICTGDTLFIGSCGRTDFPGGDTQAMYHSMRRLRGLDGDTLVLPGHDYGDRPRRRLADEAQRNPALAVTEFQEFEALPFLRG